MKMSSGVQEIGMGTVCQTATCVTYMMTVLVDLMSRTVVQVRPFIDHILKLSICFILNSNHNIYVHCSSPDHTQTPPTTWRGSSALCTISWLCTVSSYMTPPRASVLSTVVYSEHIQAQLDFSIMPWVKITQLNAS